MKYWCFCKTAPRCARSIPLIVSLLLLGACERDGAPESSETTTPVSPPEQPVAPEPAGEPETPYWHGMEVSVAQIERTDRWSYGGHSYSPDDAGHVMAVVYVTLTFPAPIEKPIGSTKYQLENYHLLGADGTVYLTELDKITVMPAPGTESNTQQIPFAIPEDAVLAGFVLDGVPVDLQGVEGSHPTP